jgi:hypothetical protein
MKLGRHLLLSAAVAAALIAIPQAVSAYWLGPAPGVGPWRYSYVYDPQYRRGPPTMRAYIRDLYLYGPAYANWKQQRRWGWW